MVVDIESSGLNPFHDRLISIGAVAVSDGLIRFRDSFKVVLRQDRPSDPGNILVHGIDGTTQVSGRDPEAGLIEFLTFAGKTPLVGFHADFDRVMIARATDNVLGMKPAWLDLAILAPALFAGRLPRTATLDDWLRVFGIGNYARHNAVADAFATTQLFQIVLAQATRQGIEDGIGLIELEKGSAG